MAAGDARYVGSVLKRIGEGLEHEQVLGRTDPQRNAGLELDLCGAGPTGCSRRRCSSLARRAQAGEVSPRRPRSSAR